jgi:cell division septation protein DedD
MNTTSRAGWLAVALLCAANAIFAQSSSITDDLARAQKQYDLYSYNLALESYKQVLTKDANNAQALSGIADCYFQLNKVDDALSWYARAVEHRSPNSDVQFRYGKVLMLKGNYDQAKRQFLEYAALNELTNTTGRHYADMCDYATKTAKQNPIYTAKNEALNTEASDFAPTFLANRVVYSSARTDIKRNTNSKSSTDWSGSAYNQLFVSQRNPEDGSLQKPAFLRNDLQNSYNEGPVSFSADGKKVAFCRNNFINGTRQTASKGLNMSLYIADVVDGEWTNVKPFPYNGSDYATGMPCLSPDGKILVFASNNPNSTTGGKGWDIYVSNLVNGEWSVPRNPGLPLNTPGNEVTPFYDGKDLYFSSDWHSGLGGLDIFRAELGKNEVKNIYHLGPGVNSSYDDYCFVYNSQQNVGYITSNRPGGRGFEDLWQVLKTSNASSMTAAITPSASLSNAMTGKPQQSDTQTGSEGDVIAPASANERSSEKKYYLTVNDSWGRPLPGVTVDMSECNGAKGQTDSEGRYHFAAVNKPFDCALELEKEGYENARVDVKEFGAHNIMVPLGLDKREEFTGRVLDASTSQPLRGAIVEFTEKGKTVQTSTDNQGKYALMLTPLSTYDIEYSHEGYKFAKITARPGADGTSKAIADVRLEPGSSGSTTRTATPTTSTQQPVQYSSTPAKPATTTLVSAKPQEEFNGYSIQLSATPSGVNESNAQKYEPLAKYGHIYTKAEEGKNKVRLGIYPTKDEAQKNLKEVNKNPQFKGAFIVEERGADKSLVLSKTATPTQHSTPTSTKAAPATTPATTTAAGNNGVCYAIQLITSPSGKQVSMNDYSNFATLGNIYGKVDNNAIRLRLGVWSNYDNADKALAQVVQKGYKDALIVTEKCNDESVKDYLISPGATQITPVKPVVHANDGSKYYVRLCALKDPNSFDATKLEGAGVNGKVEKWPVGTTGLTAVVLAGYTTFDAANADKDKVKTSGFPEAFVVRELNGTITKMN